MYDLEFRNRTSCRQSPSVCILCCIGCGHLAFVFCSVTSAWFQNTVYTHLLRSSRSTYFSQCRLAVHVDAYNKLYASGTLMPCQLLVQVQQNVKFTYSFVIRPGRLQPCGLCVDMPLATRTLVSDRTRLLLVIAHPHTECMFCSPSIIGVTCPVLVLCLSRGSSSGNCHSSTLYCTLQQPLARRECAWLEAGQREGTSAIWSPWDLHNSQGLFMD